MWAAIGDLVGKVEQRHPAKLGRDWFAYLDISSVDRESKRIIAAQRIPAHSAPSRARQVVCADDILVSTVRPNLNAVASVPGYLDGQIASTGFCVLRPNPKRVRPQYLFYYSQTETFVSHLSRVATGASYPAVTDSDVLEMPIPLPPLSEQKRIEGLLERADRLRRMRRYALELSDSFLPVAFLELFGDLQQNDHNWSFVELETHAEIVSGVAKGQKYGDRETVEVPYLRVANVQDGYLDLSEIKTIRALPIDIESLRLKAGDIVMTEGGDFDKLGRGAIWPGGIVDCIHQNHIFRVRLNSAKLSPTFFAAFLRSAAAKNYFLRCSKQTTNLASINMTQLRATPVPLPPLAIQRHFAAVVTRHQRLRASQREALRQADHLFQSLLHRAFSETG